MVKGNLGVRSLPRIGIGGTRSPNVEVFESVAAICAILARSGAALVSGGVPGVDAACHIASLDHHAGTIVVLANAVNSGLAANGWGSEALSQAVCRNGLFVSEFDDTVRITDERFRQRLLQRDRIISGLSDAFVAFECSVDSATVDTATRALAQGAKVFVVHPPVIRERKGTFQIATDQRTIAFDPNDLDSFLIAKRIIDSIDRNESILG